MLPQMFWSNAAKLFCQAQLNRVKCSFNVRHFKQLCILYDEDKFIDDLENLAISAQNETDIENVSCESELQYFASESSVSQGNQHRSKDKPVSLKQTLAYTNKVLFGPLIETAAERRKKLKAQADGIKIEHKPRRKQRSKKDEKPSITLQPLVWKPENSHFLGVFPGDASHQPTNKQDGSKVKIEHQHLGNISDRVSGFPVTQRSKDKIMIFKKPKKDASKLNKLHNIGTHKTYKLVVSSWAQDNDNSDSSAFVNKQHHDKISVRNYCDKVPEACQILSNADAAQTLSNVKFKDSLETYNLESSTSEGIFLTIDNSKFSAVPHSLDLKMIENFPLYRKGFPTNNAANQNCSNTVENISTIGIFDGGYQKLPSVSHILEVTMPEANRIALEKWKAKMVRELGEEGFKQYRSELLNRGKLLHDCIQSELRGATPSLEHLSSVKGFWTSISHVLPKVSDVVVLESRLIHPYLYYQGAVDCVGLYRGIPMLIEWKTSSKPKLSAKSMFDNPLQAVAYLGALNYDGNYHLPYQADSAMLVVAYDTGLPAHVHILSREQCNDYWKTFCSRLTQFWKKLEVKHLP